MTPDTEVTDRRAEVLNYGTNTEKDKLLPTDIVILNTAIKKTVFLRVKSGVVSVKSARCISMLVEYIYACT